MLAIIVTYEKNITESWFATKATKIRKIQQFKVQKKRNLRKDDEKSEFEIQNGRKWKKKYSWGKHQK